MGERPPTPKAVKSEYETAVFAAELGDTASIDLHGMNVETALHDLEIFLDQQFMAETEAVKIIHGRGEQKLKRAVEKLLSDHSLVEFYRSSNNPMQAGAVTYAVLARKSSKITKTP